MNATLRHLEGIRRGANAPPRLAALTLAAVAAGAVAAWPEPPTTPGPEATLEVCPEPAPAPPRTDPQAPTDAQETPDARSAPPAGPAPEAQRPPEPVGGPASMIAVPTRDIFDVLRELRKKPPKPEPEQDAYKKRMVAAAPVISYNPASGFGIGVAGNVAFFKGFPQTTSISSVVASLIVTSKKQLLFNGKFDVSTAENRWVLHGDNRIYFTSQDTYGLGTSTTPEDQINTQYTFLRFYETGYRRVYKRLYVGGGLLYNVHNDVKPDEEFEAAWPTSPYVTYSQARGFPLDSQTSAGASASVLVDSRDSAINPSGGFYTAVEYQAFFEGFLGGTSSWQQLNLDTRTYFRLSRDARHRLGVWLFGNLVTGGEAPYLDLPATAMDTYGRTGRGYVQGRFRGQRLAYGELEYRWTVKRNGLLGLVAFLNTETLSNEDTGEKLFDSFATGAGVGMRLMMNKRSKTNLAFDVGRGNDAKLRIYFAVQEAF
jgi:surface antigen Omp85-like protein